MQSGLQRNSIIQGRDGSWRIIVLDSVSEQRLVYQVESENGTKGALHFYSGHNTLCNSTLDAFKQAIDTKSIEDVIDSGYVDDTFFAVFCQPKQEIVSVADIENSVVRKLVRVALRCHKQRILLRSFRAENLSCAQNHTYFNEYANIAVLQNGTTASFAPDLLLDQRYIAPEVKKQGYGFSADYYAIGVTLYALMKGEGVFNKITNESFDAWKKNGILPGSAEHPLPDKVQQSPTQIARLYWLISGLTLPDPLRRWNAREVSIWLKGYDIPLFSSGKRVNYDMRKPLQICNTTCWSFADIPLMLLRQGAHAQNGREICREVQMGLNGQKDEWVKVLQSVLERSTLTDEGCLFECGYALNPKMSGLWVGGKNYDNTEDLVRAINAREVSKDALSPLLCDACLSRLLRFRGGDQSVIEALERIEAYERNKKYAGVERFLLRFGGKATSKSFGVEGRTYNSMQELLDYYKKNGIVLKSLCKSILNNPAFEALMNERGLEEIVKKAQGESNPQESFFLFLLICEATSDQMEKQLARKMYMRWGEYAPISWLSRNMNCYHGTTMYFSAVQECRTGDVPLTEIRKKMVEEFVKYQRFVGDTQINPYYAEQEDENANRMIVPATARYYFCLKWEGTDVTPAFYSWCGMNLPEKELSSWSSMRRTKAEQHFTKNTRWGGSSFHEISSNEVRSKFNSSVAMIILLLVTTVLGLIKTRPLYVFLLLPSFIFPLYATVYYRLKLNAAVAIGENNALMEEMRKYFAERVAGLEEQEKAVLNALLLEQDIAIPNRDRTPPESHAMHTVNETENIDEDLYGAKAYITLWISGVALVTFFMLWVSMDKNANVPNEAVGAWLFAMPYTTIALVLLRKSIGRAGFSPLIGLIPVGIIAVIGIILAVVSIDIISASAWAWAVPLFIGIIVAIGFIANILG